MSVKVAINVEDMTTDERLELMEELWNSFEEAPDLIPPTEEQMAEFHRRLDAHRRDPDSAISLEEFVADVTAP